jgi:hypothetical protein
MSTISVSLPLSLSRSFFLSSDVQLFLLFVVSSFLFASLYLFNISPPLSLSSKLPNFKEMATETVTVDKTKERI